MSFDDQKKQVLIQNCGMNDRNG